MLGGALPSSAPNGTTPMRHTQREMLEKGSHATNFFIHTPICCPSRAETMTGRYLHNVKKPVAEGQCGTAYNGHDDAGNACCMHVDEVLVNNFTFARHLKEQGGYKVCTIDEGRGLRVLICWVGAFVVCVVGTGIQ